MKEEATSIQQVLPAVWLPERRGWLATAWRLARREPLGAVSAMVILALVLVAVFADAIAPYDPYAIQAGHRLEAPSQEFPLGTDDIGRDVLSRIVHGARVSLRAGVIAVFLGVLIGSALGLVSGYAGGLADVLWQRVMDTMQAFPGLILAMALTIVLEPGINSAMIAISVLIIPAVSRVVRSTTLSIKEMPYIEAARALGAPNYRILIHHILPNSLAPIIVLISIVMGGAILIEASLSFIGLGVQPPSPSWGQMLSSSGRRYFEEAPWLVLAPGLAIAITVMAFNFLGDSLRDLLDPSLRGKR